MATGSTEVLIQEPARISAKSEKYYITRQDKHGRIEGYDAARAIAVIGMVMVNYNVIFTGIDAYPDWYDNLTDFLYGRAAALFVMLAGVGMALMGRRTFLLNDRSESKKIRNKLLKRSFLLLVMGYFFMEWWSADILHFYGIFLTTGAFFLNASGRRLWGLALSIWLLSTILYCFMDGDPGFQGLIIAPGFLSRSIDDLLFSGYYPAFPWLVFLLIGIWIGKNQIISSPVPNHKVMALALTIFLGTELLIRYVPPFLLERMGLEDGGYLDLLFILNAFPISPLLTISAAAGSIIVIIFALTMTHYRLFTKPAGVLACTGKLSLTIYITHVLIGLGVHKMIALQSSDELYRAITVSFPFGFSVITIFLSHIWFRYFTRGPLEWLLRCVSNSM